MRMLDRGMTLSNLSVGTEKHGERPVGRADLKFTDQCNRKDLSIYFASNASHKRFCDFVWNADGEINDRIGAVELTHDVVGGEAKLTSAIGKTTIDLDEINCNKLVITPIDGGAAEVSLRIQCHPTDKQIAQLYLLQQMELGVTVTRPKATKEQAEEKGQGRLALPVSNKDEPKDDDKKPGRRGMRLQ